MEKKTLLSARLDPKTLAKIDFFAKKHYYWKRNTIISNVLDAVFDNFDEKAIYDMARYCRVTHKDASGTFSLEKLTSQSDAAETTW